MSIRSFFYIVASCMMMTGIAASPLLSGEITVASDNYFSLFQDDNLNSVFAVRLGGGTLRTAHSKIKTPLGNPAVDICYESGPKGLQLWLKADQAIPDTTGEIAWWMYTRGHGGLNFDIVLERPDGKLQLFKATGRGDDFWTMSSWRLTARNNPRREIGQLKPSGTWRFRGWLFWFPEKSKGKFKWGELIFKPQPDSTEKYNWSLRDVDWTKRWMGAYSGFTLAYDNCGSRREIPVNMLTEGRSTGSITWQLTTLDHRIIGNGRLDLATIVQPKNKSFVLPKLPVGNYWLRIKVFAADGLLTRNLLLSYLVMQSDATALPQMAANNNFDLFNPGQGELRLKGDSADMRSVSLSILEGNSADTVEWKLRNGRGEIIEQHRQALSKNSGRITLHFKHRLTGQQQYSLELRAIGNNRVLDERRGFLDVAEAAEVPDLPWAGNEETPAFILRETDYRSLQANQDAGFDLFARYAGKNQTPIFLCTYWDEMEPAQNFFQYSLLEERLLAASQYKTPVIFTLYGHMDHLPEWLWYDQLLDQYRGNHLYGASYLRRYSPASQRTLAAYLNTIRQIVSRYRTVPLIVGWNFSQGIESFWSDSARTGMITDYSNSMTALLGKVPPDPVFSQNLDLRPDWLSFEAAKQNTVSQVFDRTFMTIRQNDPKREIYQYAVNGVGDPNCFLPLFQKYGATVCFGASESTYSAFVESLCAQSRVKIDAESSGVPPSPESLIYTLYNRLAFGAWGGGINIMWGRFFSPQRIRELTGVHILRNWLKILNQQKSNEVISSGFAIGSGVRSMINHSRSMMWADWIKSNSYHFGDALVYALRRSAQCGFVTEKSSLQQLNRWPVILFLETPLLDKADGRNLVEYVRQGGKLILQGDTGRYDIDGCETWHLRHAFGLAFDTEQPVKFGRGLVQWRRQPIAFKSDEDLFSGTLAWTGCRRPVETDASDIWCALRATPDKKTLYLILLRRDAAKSTRPELLSSVVKFNSLPPSAGWRLHDLMSKEETVLSPRSLSGGYQVSLKPAELKVIRMEAL